METETDLQESLTPDADVDTSGETQPEAPEYTATERKLYARVKKLEAQLNAPKAEPKLPESRPVTTDTSSLIEGLTALRDLKDTEIAELKSEAETLGVDLIKYVKSKAGQAHLTVVRGAQDIDETTPAPSKRSPALGTREVDTVLTNPEASPEEKQRAFEQKLKGVRK